MKDITLWSGWYGLLLGIPLIILSLACAEWIIGVAHKRVMCGQYRPER